MKEWWKELVTLISNEFEVTTKTFSKSKMRVEEVRKLIMNDPQISGVAKILPNSIYTVGCKTKLGRLLCLPKGISRYLLVEGQRYYPVIGIVSLSYKDIYAICKPLRSKLNTNEVKYEKGSLVLPEVRGMA